MHFLHSVRNGLTAIALLAFALSCAETTKDGKPLDTHNSGHIHIAVDPAMQPVMESEVDVFEDLFKEAKIDAHYVSDAEAMSLLFSDSVRLVVIPRLLSDAEKAEFEKLTARVRTTLIAYDAIAVIRHPSRKDSTLTFQQLEALISGATTTWGQLNGEKRQLRDSIRLVVDDAGSSTVRFLLDSLTLGKGKLGARMFNAGGNAQVIDYVSKNKDAIGFIPLAWISDRNDSTANTFLSVIRVMEISDKDGKVFVGPYAAYFAKSAKSRYPMMRRVYIHSREPRVGLGTGFTAFVAGDSGQRIVLKADLLPGQGYIRLVEMQKQPL